MVSYLRLICRERFFAKNKPLLDIKPQHITLTRPKDLFYEVYVFSWYKHILEYVKMGIEFKSKLEEDLELLKGELKWSVRMAVVYRSERKKIVRNQIRLVDKVLEDLEAIIRYIGAAGQDIQSEHFQ